METRAHALSILLLLLAIGVATPTRVEAVDTTCNGCIDCADKLNSGSYETVRLTVDIIDHPGTCIGLTADDVTLDCDGHRLDGDDLAIDPEVGIFVANVDGSAVRNCDISGFDVGIEVFNSSNVTVADNTATGVSGAGLHLSHSNSGSVHGNTFIEGQQGILISNSDSNRIDDNVVCENHQDFELQSGSGNTGDGNSCNEPDGWNDIGTSGCTTLCAGTTTCTSCADCTSKLTGSYDTVVLRNDITGHSGTCITFGTSDATFSCDGNTIDGDDSGLDYGVRIANRNNNEVRDCDIRDFYEGILIDGGWENTLDGNTLRSNTNHGIRLESTNRNTIAYFNTASGNAVYGISLFDSDDNSILFNDVHSNLGGGIRLDSSRDNIVTDNEVYDQLAVDSWGIHLYDSDSNAVSRNEVNDNYQGIKIDDGRFNALDSNTVCSSGNNRDFSQVGADSEFNSGDLNTCDYAWGWDDSNRTDCTYRCSSCSDGVQNFNEQGVDCGGTYCPPCADCDTDARYAPTDTECREAWPDGDGPAVDINTSSRSCNLFEVCDPSLDYMIEDAVECCENESYLSVIDGDRLEARRDACRYGHGAYGDNFKDEFDYITMKKCMGRYLIHGIGRSALYMQGYFRGEFCCFGSEAFCEDAAPDCPVYETKPTAWEMGTDASCTDRVEETPDFEMGGHRCEYRYFLWWEWGEPGYWRSDDNYRSNNDSAADIPAHASINELSTGTCVDYAIATATALRKAGYAEDEVYAVDGDGHDYNLVKFPDDTQYYYVDTTGNRGGIKWDADWHCCQGGLDSCSSATDEGQCDDVSGCEWSGSSCTGTPEDDSCWELFSDADEATCGVTAGCTWERCTYDYCGSLDQGCYHDNLGPSQSHCPTNDDIHGCEGLPGGAPSAGAPAPPPPTSSRSESTRPAIPSSLRSQASPRIQFEPPADEASPIGQCSGTEPCVGVVSSEPGILPPAYLMAVTKTLSSERVLLGDRVSVAVEVRNLGKSDFWVTVQEDFVPGFAYIGLRPKRERYESLTVRYHTWRVQVPSLSTHTIRFDVEPLQPGVRSLAPTLASAGRTLKKATAPPITVRCRPNGVCEEGEDHFNCKPDCASGGLDGYCDRLEDGRNDPDCPYHMDPDYDGQDDTDGDGVTDGKDSCPRTTPGSPVNPIGCACYQTTCDDQDPMTLDSCVYATVQCVHTLDADLDGVADKADNCRSIYNPNQWDSDEDGIGDQCEIGPISSNTRLEKGTYHIRDLAGSGALSFKASNVALDCSHSKIVGDGTGYGIYVPPSLTGVTIENCHVSGYQYGIFLDGSGKHLLRGNSLERNESGVVVAGAGGSRLEGNRAEDNEQSGIYLEASSNNQLRGNLFSTNGAGLLMLSSSSNEVSDNLGCYNERSDFFEEDSSNGGDNNTCSDADGWNDDGETGCTHECPDIVCEGDFDCDGDVDGGDLFVYSTGTTGVPVDDFAADFGRIDCGACAPGPTGEER